MAVFDSETQVPSLNVKGILKLDRGNAFQHMRWIPLMMQISKLHRTPQHRMRPHLTRPKQFVELLRFIYTSRLAKVFSRFHCCFFRSEKKSRDRGFRICFFSFGGSVSVQFVGPSAFLQVSVHLRLTVNVAWGGSKEFQQSCQLTWQYFFFNNSTTFCWPKNKFAKVCPGSPSRLFFQTIVLVEDIFHQQNIVEDHL